MDTITREADVHQCFRLLLGREPKPEELPAHLFLVGMPVEDVVRSYLESLEFRNRGLLAGSGRAELVDLPDFQIYVAEDDRLIAPAIRAGYEPEVSRVFLEHLNQSAVIDIGANCGYFTLLAASRGRQVYAFEPLQRNLQLLHASLAQNRFTRVSVIAAAASDRSGTLTIGAAFTNGTVGIPSVDPRAALAADYIAAVRIDDVLPAGVTAGLIKIDVEGHEYRAMAGAVEMIKACRPVILSELSPAALEANSKRSAQEYLGLLKDLGYRLSVIGDPEANTIDRILESCQGLDHIDILGLPDE